MAISRSAESHLGESLSEVDIHGSFLEILDTASPIKGMKTKVVKWRDSNIYLTQCHREDDFEVEVITSVGFLVSETKDQIVLAGDSLGDDVRRVIVIPKENIIG